VKPLLICHGNNKLGELAGWQLPAITTCPGSTSLCRSYCFGLRGFFTQKNVKEANESRLDATFRRDFVDQIVSEIWTRRATTFRLHIIGDFYDSEYIEKWRRIAELCPNTIFFGSTRSWRIEGLADALKRLRDMKNVYLRASSDLTDKLHPCKDWSEWMINGQGFPCPHDSGKVANCVECKICFSVKTLDITFNLRWADPGQYQTIPMWEGGEN